MLDHRQAPIRLDRGSIRPGPAGSWYVDGLVIEHDTCLAYPEFGTVEFVPRSTVVDSHRGLIGCPITIEHETREVTPANAAGSMHGVVTDSRITDAGNEVTVQVLTLDAMEAIRDGAFGLSPAYHPTLVERRGTSPRGDAYTHVQTGRTYNNLTLTSSPRAGARARLRIDGARPMHTLTTPDGKTHKITTLQLDGLRFRAEQHKAAPRTDAEVKTGKLSIKMADGTAVDLVLPESSIKGILDGLGATMSEAPATPDPEGSGAKPMPMPGMDGAAKTDSAKPAAPVKPDDIEQRLDAKIRDAERRATLIRKCSPMLGDRDVSNLDEAGIMVATIGLRTDSASHLPAAQALADQARKAKEPEARGRALGVLEHMVSGALEHHRAHRADAMGVALGDDYADLLAGPRSDSESRADSGPADFGRAAMVKRRAEACRPKGKAA